MEGEKTNEDNIRELRWDATPSYSEHHAQALFFLLIRPCHGTARYCSIEMCYSPLLCFQSKAGRSVSAPPLTPPPSPVLDGLLPSPPLLRRGCDAPDPVPSRIAREPCRASQPTTQNQSPACPVLPPVSGSGSGSMPRLHRYHRPPPKGSLVCGKLYARCCLHH